MLKFFETFQKHDVPEEIKDELYNTKNEKLNSIDNFSKINIFIGANNSGKSKLIRELIKQTPINYYGTKNWNIIVEEINKIFSIVDDNLFEIHHSKNYFIISNSGNGEIFNTEELVKVRETLTQHVPNYDISDTIKQLEQKFITLLENINKNTSYYLREINSSSRCLDDNQKKIILLKFNDITQQVKPIINNLKRFEFSSLAKPGMARIYIPSVRTLRPFGTWLR